MQIQIKVTYAWWVNPLANVVRLLGRVVPIPAERLACFIANRGVKMTCKPE